MMKFIKPSLHEAHDLVLKGLYADRGENARDGRLDKEWEEWASRREEGKRVNDKRLMRPGCVPRKLHNTNTGKVESMNTLREGQSYATVSHVWAETMNVQWEAVACEIGRELGVDFVWVDKTCISQTNETEKAEELPKMAQYYTEAKLNVIVLGTLKMAEVINEWIRRGRPMDTDCHRAALNKLAHLLRVPTPLELYCRYFDRVWTMQEFELARYHVILAADGLVEGEDLDMLMRSADRTAMQVLLHDYNGWTYDIKGIGFHFFNNTVVRADVDNQAWAKELRRPLTEVWKLANGRICKDPRYIVWGVLSLTRGGERVQINYSEPLQKVVAELLEKEPNLCDILAIKTPARAGEIPDWCAYPSVQVGDATTRFPNRLRAGKIEIEAVELTAWEERGRVGFKFPERQQAIDNWPTLQKRDTNMEAIMLRTQRYWGVPLWRVDKSWSQGVVLADENSQGLEVHKIESLGLFNIDETDLTGSSIIA